MAKRTSQGVQPLRACALPRMNVGSDQNCSRKVYCISRPRLPCACAIVVVECLIIRPFAGRKAATTQVFIRVPCPNDLALLGQEMVERVLTAQFTGRQRTTFLRSYRARRNRSINSRVG